LPEKIKKQSNEEFSTKDKCLLIAREEQKYFPTKAKSGVTNQEEQKKSIVQWNQLDHLVYAMI